MHVERPGVDEAGAIVDCWVDLARDQRAHGSHLRAGSNREAIRRAVLRHVVTDGLFVARIDPDEDGDVIAGFVMFSVESGSYEQDVTRGVIENLYVRPGYRNRGIGSALLSAAEDALAEDADVIALEVMADNEAARRFYRRHGYDSHRLELERSVENDIHSKDEG